MATQDEYKAVAVALEGLLLNEIHTKVPGWAQHMIPPALAPALAKESAQTAVDVLDKYRANKAAGAT